MIEKDDVDVPAGPFVAAVYEEDDETLRVSVQATNLDKTRLIGALVMLKHAIDDRMNALLNEKQGDQQDSDEEIT